MAGAGQRREIIAFDQRATGDSTYGKKPGAWVEQCKEFARQRYLRGSEPIIAQRLSGTNTVIFSVPSSTATRLISTGWRARNLRSGETFNILSVTPGERPFELDILREVGGIDG